MARPKTPKKGQPAQPRHRKWIVHAHDAFRPAQMEAKSDINITPLIDVMLVLLIIFMVVTPLAQKGLDIALPQPPPPGTPQTMQPQNTVVLSIEEGNIITVNRSPVGVEELESRLKDIFAARQDKTIFVRAQGKIAYGRVVQAMDIARGSGVERIGIISEKMVEQAGGVVGD
jgi:biopolymer transport protein TolR